MKCSTQIAKSLRRTMHSHRESGTIIEKTRVSAFYQTGLHELLSEKSITSISIGGCMTQTSQSIWLLVRHMTVTNGMTVLSGVCIAADEHDHISALESSSKRWLEGYSSLQKPPY